MFIQEKGVCAYLFFPGSFLASLGLFQTLFLLFDFCESGFKLLSFLRNGPSRVAFGEFDHPFWFIIVTYKNELTDGTPVRLG